MEITEQSAQSSRSDLAICEIYLYQRDPPLPSPNPTKAPANIEANGR